MSPKCRPVVGSSEDVERAAGVALGQLPAQLDALRLAAERGRALASRMLRPTSGRVWTRARASGWRRKKAWACLDGHVRICAMFLPLYWTSSVSRL